MPLRRIVSEDSIQVWMSARAHNVFEVQLATFLGLELDQFLLSYALDIGMECHLEEELGCGVNKMYEEDGCETNWIDMTFAVDSDRANRTATLCATLDQQIYREV